MRLFEIILIAATGFSIVNLIFIHNSRAGLLLSATAAAAAAASIAFKGYRLFMAPLYLLSLILLVAGITRSIRGTRATSCRIQRASALRILNAAGIGMLTILFIASLALAILVPVVDLPEPSGPYYAGTALLAFTDTSRANEPADTVQYRKIPVRIWYPVSDISGEKCVNWMDSSEMSRLFAQCKNIPNLVGQLTLIKTNSYRDAALSDKEEKFPVVLFSGGGAMFNGQNVVQMEELASHGYIVCAVGHPYDDFACEYPDGTILSYDPEHLKALGKDVRDTLEAAKKQYGDDGKNPEFIRYVLHNCTLNNADAIKWSKDMSFVADELTRLNNGENTSNGEQDMLDTMKMFTGRLDLERLGIFGHSFGGAAAGEACLRDDRFKAFINMDGTPFGTAVDNVISQPFMILTTGKDEKKIISKGYSVDQKNFITVYISGAEHMNFSDFNTILPNIGELTGLLGKIDGDRQREIMNEYILTFFNKHLKGVQKPMPESNTTEYPEVMLEVR